MLVVIVILLLVRRGLHTNSASTDFLALIGVLGGDHTRHVELIIVGEHTQPETNLLGRELTFSHCTALDEWRGSEAFKTTTWRLKLLTASFRTRASMHNKTVSIPQSIPVLWTTWYCLRLTMHGNDISGRLTHRASTYIVLDLLTLHWRLWQWESGTQPIG